MKTAPLLIIFFLLLFPLSLYVSEMFAKHKATETCNRVKTGMTVDDVNKLVADTGVRKWEENNAVFALAVTGGMGSAYFCRLRVSNGTIKNVEQVIRMPGG